MRELALFLSRNLWTSAAAIGLLGALALKAPPLAVLSGAVLALVNLRRGWVMGTVAAIAASAMVAAAWSFWGSRPGLNFPLVFALWPVLLIAAASLRKTGSQGAALLMVGLCVAGYVLGMHIVVGDVVAFWRDWLQRAVTGVPGATVRGFEENDTLRLMNGFLGFLYGLSAMIGLLGGRWLQALAYNPGGFGPEFRRLGLSKLVLALAVAVVWAASFWDQVLASDLFIVGVLLYFFVGLAMVHAIVANRSLSWGWLVPVYLLLVYMPPFAISGLALLGATDAFVDFRSPAAR